MTVLVITPPEPLVTLAEAKAHLRRTLIDDEDTLIEGLINAATSHIDGPHGWLSRAVGQQTLEFRSNVFCGVDRLPCGPVQTIEEVRYVDVAGVERTLPDTIYDLSDDRFLLAPGAAWPRVNGSANGVRVKYVAGFANVPAAIKQAALLLIGQWFAVREATNVGNIVNELPFSVRALLSPYRFIKI